MRKQRGDIAIFMVLMMVGIMNIIIIAASQKTLSDINIGRSGIGSQQAIQVANMGVDVWYQNASEGSFVFDSYLEETVLDEYGITARYVVEYDDQAQILTSKGYVELPGGQNVLRVLEVRL